MATLALALASSAVFIVSATHDRAVLNQATSFYVDSGLAAIELPHYRDYLQQSTDSDAVARLAQLERAAGPSLAHPLDPMAAIETLRSDRPFERDLHAGKVVPGSDPDYAHWQRDHQEFDHMMASAVTSQLTLSARTWREPWRLVSYLLVHPSAAIWLTNLLVLLLIGPFVEALAGAGRFLLCYLLAGAFGGVLNLLLSGPVNPGDWIALMALGALLASTSATRPMYARLVLSRMKIGVPGWAALALPIGVEALRWLVGSRGGVNLTADLAGTASGAVLAQIFNMRGSRRLEELRARPAVVDTGTGASEHSGLLREAQEAAKRLNTRRAKELFKELVDLEPQRIDHLCGYLNVALLGPDETTLQDAALRLLWLRSRSHSDQVRKAFLLLTQPKVLKVLPIDEHLRLARRLVRLREDAAALRVLDAILTDAHLRQLYGRQLADCLLGIYTGYMRHRLTTLADTIRSRLTTYFEAPDNLGGLPPTSRPPTTLLTTSQRVRRPPTRS